MPSVGYGEMIFNKNNKYRCLWIDCLAIIESVFCSLRSTIKTIIVKNMTKYVSADRLPDFATRKNLAGRRRPFSFDLEITARCNHNCKHCYINLPPNDLESKEKELSLSEINDISDQAVSLGSL